MTYQALIFLYFSLFFSTAYGQKQLYSTEDLSILQKEQNYREFLDHAHDIRPSKRSKNWKTSLLEMAQGYLNDLISKKDFSRSSFQFTQKIAFWTTIKDQELFQLKKTQYSLQYLEHCFKNRSRPEACQRDLEDFWNCSTKYIERPDIAARLGTLLAPYKTPQELWTYLKVAATSRLSVFYCKRPLFQESVLQQANHNVDLNDPKAKKKLLRLANLNCWNKITPEIKNWLNSSDKSKIQYAYNLLETLGNLTQLEKDTYLTRYLLQDPPVGDTFNIAWNNIKIIAQDYSRRMSVIKALLTFDPLPGATFASRDNKKREILTDLIFKSIPEYFDHYSKTCYQYLSGKKQFPNGNPTIECRQLIKSPKAKKWISAPVLQKFKNLPVFI